MPAETPVAGSPGAPAEEDAAAAAATTRSPPGTTPTRKAPPEKMGSGSESARRPPRPAGSESEKDSGFSDASSEYLSALEQTDTEEVPKRRATRAPLQRLGRPFASLAPVYIVKNVLLKQPLADSSDAQLAAWSGRPSPEPAQGRGRLLVLQQPVPAAALAPSLPDPKRQSKDTYLPILNAYPKIAPHPGRPRRVGSTKRYRPDESWEAATPVGEGGGGKDGEAETGSLSKAPGKAVSSAGKQRRFRNTVEILRRSGLLGITLRTKELLRQNGSTQRELAELREHARLLGEAVRSNDAGAWARLQRAVSLTAAYWARRGVTGVESAEADEAGPATDFGDGETAASLGSDAAALP
ncbi:CLOCK-interacting pacemaker-like [Struthio camelus]|uniref:CLOCK-interacting pacemaker-like n=1 Tax=Struthio camelus TaxID=8801 RepID=UPI003603DE48